MPEATGPNVALQTPSSSRVIVSASAPTSFVNSPLVIVTLVAAGALSANVTRPSSWIKGDCSDGFSSARSIDAKSNTASIATGNTYDRQLMVRLDEGPDLARNRCRLYNAVP